MDYCHPCQRHLNGALSCSGCGASAEECRAHPDALSVRDHAAVDEREDASGEEATPESPSGGRRARSRSQGRGRGGRAGQGDMPVGERDDAFEDAADG
ncbi:SCO2400 family protein, partial [Streptomyces europaeiscabiei]